MLGAESINLGQFAEGTICITLTDKAFRCSVIEGELAEFGVFGAFESFVFSWPLLEIDWIDVSRRIISFGREGNTPASWMTMTGASSLRAVDEQWCRIDKRSDRDELGKLGRALVAAAANAQRTHVDPEREGRARSVLSRIDQIRYTDKKQQRIDFVAPES